ncbi:MAG: hypothetical protein JWM34_2869 [Ilumatobacteraceae bacterium]|nr:hypothetical protein [Ilumatobacteraceae bacterium]
MDDEPTPDPVPGELERLAQQVRDAAAARIEVARTEALALGQLADHLRSVPPPGDVMWAPQPSDGSIRAPGASEIAADAADVASRAETESTELLTSALARLVAARDADVAAEPPPWSDETDGVDGDSADFDAAVIGELPASSDPVGRPLIALEVLIPLVVLVLLVVVYVSWAG